MTATALTELFEKDLAQMRAGDVDGMLENYHPDAEILRLPDVTATGRDGVRGFLEGYLALQPKILEVRSLHATENAVVYHSIIELAGEQHGIVGTWVLREGKIWRQTAAIVPA